MKIWVMNFKDSEEGYIGGLPSKGGKGREKCYKYLIITKLKNNLQCVSNLSIDYFKNTREVPQS